MAVHVLSLGGGGSTGEGYIPIRTKSTGGGGKAAGHKQDVLNFGHACDLPRGDRPALTLSPDSLT